MDHRTATVARDESRTNGSRDADSAAQLDVGVVHDYVTQRGGAERVVLELLRAFPQAPLYTSLFDPDGTFEGFREHDVRPSLLNAVPIFRRSHRAAFPLLAPAFSLRRVQHDVVLCSSSGWAHGVRTRGLKVVYCHAPARWLYQAERYMGQARLSGRALLKLASPPLRAWDKGAMRSADVVLANSRATKDAIEATYGIDATVVHPPHSASVDVAAEPVNGVAAGTYLVVSRLLPYKNVDAIIDAFRLLPDRQLAVVGAGPDRARLRATSPANVSFLGEVSDPQLAWLYGNCTALVAASYEDFGLTPLEAAHFGKPSAALRFGGFLDSIVEGRTGVFFDEPTASSIRDALLEVEGARWDTAALTNHAESFSPVAFRSRLDNVLGVAPGSRATTAIPRPAADAAPAPS